MSFSSLTIATVVLCLSLAGAEDAFAAAMNIVPRQGNFARGERVVADVRIDSEGESINAAQAKWYWPSGVLELIDVS